MIRAICKILGVWGDQPVEMRLNPLDDRTAARLLAGAVTSEDAPPGYAGVAQLLIQARQQPAPGELRREAATVAAMRSAIESRPTPISRPEGRPMIKRLISAKVAAAAALLAFSATGAAAATGSLPGAAQQTASDALAKVGISVPGPNDHAAGHADTRGASADHPTTDATDTTDTTEKPAHEPNEHAAFGQCTAAAARAQHSSTTVTTVAEDTCSTVVHPGQGNGKPADPGSQADDHKPESTPPSTPTSAPESESEHGTDIASQHDGGASSTGADAASRGRDNAANHG
jgi:hypothetical protein